LSGLLIAAKSVSASISNSSLRRRQPLPMITRLHEARKELFDARMSRLCRFQNTDGAVRSALLTSLEDASAAGLG